MHALLSADQRDLAATAEQVADRIGITNPIDLETADRSAGWARLVEVGFTGLRQRDDGDPLASGVEVAVVAESLGRHLVPQPFLPSAVLAVELLARAGASADLIEAALGDQPHAALLSGDLRGWAAPGDDTALAWGAVDAPWTLAVDAEDGRLVRSRVDAAERTNVSVDPTQSLWAASGSAETETVGVLGADDLDAVLALTLATIGADTVGLMRKALEGAVEYSKDRIAYGVPTGSFQAIQHLAAETLVMIEGVSGAVSYAAWCVDEEHPAVALLAARTAKAQAAAVARTVTENVMQIYGGIGQTWEHVAHLFTRRALLNTELFGGEDVQLDLIADARLKRQ